jgi:hypothetical protein
MKRVMGKEEVEGVESKRVEGEENVEEQSVVRDLK